MAEGGHVVLAWFRPHPGRAEPFAEQMRRAAGAVRAGDGVRQFEFHADAGGAGEYLLYEEFADQGDWQAHHDTAEMIALRAAIDPMLADRTRSVWTQVAGYVNQEVAPGHTTLVKFRMEPQSVTPMLAEMRDDVAAAKGMLRFDLNRNEKDAEDYFICARWADRDAWQAHQLRPDYVAFRERTAGFYATKPDRTLWRPLR